MIEPDEHKDFLATLERSGLAEDDFALRETDTIGSDRLISQQGWWRGISRWAIRQKR
jgi:hypothetical protein